MRLQSPVLFRNEPEPLFERDSNLSDALQENVTAFLDSLRGTGFSPRLIENVWVANRCMQLNCQQIASMPLRFIGSQKPAWLTNPDPVWYPNGIGDAVFAATWSMYGWGDAFLLVTARYADGFPSAWTVLDPAYVGVQAVNGRRVYQYGGQPISEQVVQISRNPTGNLRGSSAVRSYSAQLWGTLTAGELSRSLLGEGGIPSAVLKSQRKITKEQAEELQDQWMARMASRRGPAVLPPEIDFEQLAFSPRDLLLLDAQEFNARVIASAFGVPASMLNMPLTGGLTYQNPELLFDQWWRAELRPAAERVSDALTAQMLPRGSSVHFDARETLAPTRAEQHKMWLEALAAGAVTPDEYRQAVFNLPPLGTEDAIDELLQPAVADATPAGVPAAVIAIRPTQAVS